MLYEALTWLLTPCPAAARREGYLSQAIGLEARWRRCRTAWQPHCEACKAAITAAVARTPGRQRVTVLGSGVLAEIPLGPLAAAFAEVLLVDRVHLPSAFWQARRYRNIRLLHQDLVWLAGSGQDAPQPAAALQASQALSADLVISANLLSQLPLLPLERLARRGVAQETCRAIGCRIISQHLALLPALGRVSCLITDTARRVYGSSGLISCKETLFGVPLPPPDACWQWSLAPRPERFPDRDQIHDMISITRISPEPSAPCEP